MSISAINSFSHTAVFPVKHTPSLLETLAFRVKNFVSKYFLEPLEHFYSQASSFWHALIWAIKYSNYKIATSFPSKTEIKLIDANFEKSPYFEKLQSLDPLLANPQTRKERIDLLNRMLSEGTCWGQSLILLNDPDLLKSENSHLEQLGCQATYLQTIQLLQISVHLALDLQKRIEETGRDPREFISSSGNLDEAKLFDFIHQEKPKVYRFIVREWISSLSPELFSMSRGELLAKKVQLSSAVNAHFTNPVSYQEDHLLVKKGMQEDLDRKVHDFFMKNKGAFVLSSWDNERKLGHAVFIDNREKKCHVFDPALSTSYQFPDTSVGIQTMLQFMHSLFPSAVKMHHRVSTLSPTA